MQILSRRTLREFWERHPHAKGPLEAWYTVVAGLAWNRPSDIKAMFGSADFVGDNRVIFNVGGNKYRLVVRIAYGPYYRVMIKFVGTHQEYDQIDPETV